MVACVDILEPALLHIHEAGCGVYFVTPSAAAILSKEETERFYSDIQRIGENDPAVVADRWEINPADGLVKIDDRLLFFTDRRSLANALRTTLKHDLTVKT